MRRYFYTYQEPMPVEQLVAQVSDLKQGYTQYGGMLINSLPLSPVLIISYHLYNNMLSPEVFRLFNQTIYEHP